MSASPHGGAGIAILAPPAEQKAPPPPRLRSSAPFARVSNAFRRSLRRLSVQATVARERAPVLLEESVAEVNAEQASAPPPKSFSFRRVISFRRSRRRREGDSVTAEERKQPVDSAAANTLNNDATMRKPSQDDEKANASHKPFSRASPLRHTISSFGRNHQTMDAEPLRPLLDDLARRGRRVCPLAQHDEHLRSAAPYQSSSSYSGAGAFVEGSAASLNSYERRLRSQKSFVVNRHAAQGLFCPEQASQIEVEIASSGKDFVIQIWAPNGERSSPLTVTGSGMPARFSPSKIGCGHGVWRLAVYERVGTRFFGRSVLEENVRGAGLLVYQVDMRGALRLQERLWLDVID